MFGTERHEGAYHDVGNNCDVRVVVTENYRTRGWDGHHGEGGGKIPKLSANLTLNVFNLSIITLEIDFLFSPKSGAEKSKKEFREDTDTTL